MKTRSENYLQKTLLLILSAFIGKGFGFIRELVLAYFFGTSYISDVYVAVQNIPSIIFTVFGTAVTTGFIPLYVDIKVNKNKEEADKFANNVFNIFLILSLVLSLLGIVFSKQLVYLFAGGFKGDTFVLCNNFTKIIMPTSVAIILVYVYNAYLQIEGYFNQNSLINVPYNTVQILFIAVGFYLGQAYLLALGLLLASFSQLVYLRVLIKKKTSFRHSTYCKPSDGQIRQMLVLVGPVFISTGVNQINSIIDRALASRLPEGSVSALNYSGEVSNIVKQVVIMSLTTILYPKMTELFAENDTKRRGVFIEKFINVVSVLVLPLSLLVFLFSKEIIQILFGRGAFTDETVLFVSRALRIYSVGIIGSSYRDAFNKVFYSMKNTVIPMANGIVTVALNIALNFLLIKKYAYLGLAFATSFSSVVCVGLMFVQLTRKMKGVRYGAVILEFCKTLLACAGMALAFWGLDTFLPVHADFWRCAVYAPLCLLLYGGVLLLLREKLAVEYLKKAIRKIKKTSE